MPARGLDGCAFAGPGVDLVGDETRPALEAAAPLVAWLVAREPGIEVRSLSLDFARARVLVTYRAAGSLARPHVLRVDPPASSELVEAAAPLAALLGAAARDRLARRALR